MNTQITLGIPQSMLYHEFHFLWDIFFDELGIQTVKSGNSNRKIIKKGMELSVDEACFSTKIFLGHVNELIGKCDYILVPRVNNWGRQREMCTKFSALHDVCTNVFYESGQKFISYNIDVRRKNLEKSEMVSLAKQLGIDKRKAEKAYDNAKKKETAIKKALAEIELRKLNNPGIKIIVAAHSYVIDDAYIGKIISDYMDEQKITLIYADRLDFKENMKKSLDVSPTLKWELSRKIVGGLETAKDKVDGIILVSAFPCGPDSIVNEIIIRKFKGIPILNIVLDSQSGTAGLETRLESFVDILRMRRKTNDRISG